MNSFSKRIFVFYNSLKSKIAFYPSLISIAGFVVALVMIILEKKGISRHLIEIFPLLMVEDGGTALSVLSTCIGGLISMMVFSFSMVMLLLSQASSNFSPRLLPGLISDKKHQIILGIFLASIIYNIFTLFSIEPSEEKYTLPGVSVLLGVLFTIVCLSSFIFFIHNISQSIQINNIMDSIYQQAIKRLNQVIDVEKEIDMIQVQRFPNTADWYSYTSSDTGYLQNIDTDNIWKICEREDIKIYITIPKGLFVLKNVRVLKSNKPLNDDLKEKILKNLNFSRGEYITNNYLLAFKQITEIAVKAMSPGINDPGTALNAIDYITELFALRMKKLDFNEITEENKTHLKVAIIQFEEVLYNVMASLRTYCKQDPIVVQKLIWMLSYLKNENAVEESYTKAVETELEILLATATFDSERDKNKIIALAQSQPF